jgi:hypothetical protein
MQPTDILSAASLPTSPMRPQQVKVFLNDVSSLSILIKCIYEHAKLGNNFQTRHKKIEKIA